MTLLICTSFNPHDVNTYGVDPTGPLPDEDLTTVSVPEIIAPIEGDQLLEFLDSINTDTPFSSYSKGTSYFVSTKTRLQNLL